MRGFIFCPILSLTKERFSNERWCNFRTFIDLEFESEIRKDKYAFQGSEINPSGPIMFGNLLTIKAIDHNISKEISSSKWFSHSNTYTIGNTMLEAKEFIAEILPLLMNSLKCAESKFDFPKPLDMMSVNILIERRDAASKRDPTIPPEQPNSSHLWKGFCLGSSEQVASMMVSFSRKIGDLAQVATYDDFLHSEKPAIEQIVYTSEYYRRKGSRSVKGERRPDSN